MLYIIMCGGDYPTWDTPRQLLKVGSETILERTMRLLRECGVDNIAISSNDDRFEAFGVPVLRHVNDYTSVAYNQDLGHWCNAFYPTEEPTCYLLGDVFFSPEAIRKIVDTDTDDIAFFGSAFPFAPEYPKPYIEPFAFKVVDTDHLKAAVEEVKRLDAEGKFNRQPIAWEVWNVINGNADPNYIDPNSYVHINDYTCDIDWPSEASLVERFAHHG